MESSKGDGLYHREDISSDSDCMYHCTFPGCTYETNRSAHLKRHERIHTNERPYKCPYCDYCASRSDHLRRHFKIHGKATANRYVRVCPQPTVVKVEPIAQTVPVRRILPLPIYQPPFQSSCRPTTIDEGTALFIRFIQKCNLEAKKAYLARS